MKMKKQVISTLLAAALTAATLPVMAQNLAVVNGKPIPQERYNFFVEQFKQAGQPVTPDVEQHIKDELVRRAVFEQQAEKEGLQNNKTFKEEMDLARQTFLIKALFMKYQEAHPITDAEIKAAYEKHVASVKGEEYDAAHIMVKTEAEAKAIIAELKKNPGKFAELAKKDSQDPGSAAQGGNLGWAPANTYVPAFSAALVKLKKGEITQEPVHSQFGWHVIKLIDERPVQPPALDLVRPQIMEKLQEEQLLKYQEQLFKEAKIQK